MAEPAITTEAPQISLEDRIAAKFGGVPPELPTAAEPEPQEAQPEQPEPEAQPEPQWAEIEFGEAKYEVPVELKDAFMRNKDYSQKTEELAKTRRAIDEQAKAIQQFNEARQFEASMAEYVDYAKHLALSIQDIEKQTNWTGAGFEEITRTRELINQMQKRHQEIIDYVEGSRKQFQETQSEARKRARSESFDALSKSITGWSDETRAQVEEYAKGLGYPEAALPQMTSLDYQVAWKAMMYDKVSKDVGKVQAKAAQSQPGTVVKARARQTMSKDTQNALNFRKAVTKATDARERQKIVEDRIGQKFNKLF